MDVVTGVIWNVICNLIASAIVKPSRSLRSSPRSSLPFWVVRRDIRALAEKIKDDRAFRPDAIVAISRSGAIVGGMLVGLLLEMVDGMALEAPIVMAIRPDRQNKKRSTKIAYCPTDLTQFRRIVLVTCTNDTGHALSTAAEWIAEHAPSVQVKTAAVYSNNQGLIHPDHVGREPIGSRPYDTRDLVKRMPWMVDGWSHDLPHERRLGKANKR